MSVTRLITNLEKLLKLHEMLLELGKKKTGILREGDIDALNDHMKEEQKYILAIRQLEEERKQLVDFLLKGFILKESDKTLSQLIEVSKEPERTELTLLQEQLLNVILDLKNVNTLNQQLTQQSLQLVNMTMSMLRPQAPVMNYDKPETKKPPVAPPHRSMFDSKA